MQFENRYFVSDEMMAEYIKKALCKNIRLTGLIFSLLSGAMLAVTLAQDMKILAAVFGVCLFIMVTVPLLTPSLTLRQMRDAQKQLHNGERCETVIRFGEDISMEEGTVSLRVTYGQIKHIVKLSCVCVLVIGKNNAVLVSPSGFSVGEYEEFLTFIQEKTGAVAK